MISEVIFQKRHLDKELPHAAYCEEHRLFTNATPNRVSMTVIKEFLNDNEDTTGDYLTALICPNCKAKGIINVCRQEVCPK